MHNNFKTRKQCVDSALYKVGRFSFASASLLSLIFILSLAPSIQLPMLQEEVVRKRNMMSSSPSSERVDEKGVAVGEDPASLSVEEDREAQVHLKTFLVVFVSACDHRYGTES